MTNIAFYGSHNGAMAVERNGEILIVVEIERFCNYKNAGIAQYKTIKDIHIGMEFIIKWIQNKFNIKEFDNCIVNTTVVNMDGVSYDLHNFIPYKNLIRIGHHQAHAAGAFYQSPYEEALIFSFDGGGDDGKYNIYLANKKTGISLLESVVNPILNNDHIKYDLGFPYATFGEFFEDIRKEGITDGNLTYPGKIMGLCSYGTVKEEWIPYFMEYYKENAASGEFQEAIQRLIGDKIGVIFDVNNRFSGNIAYDIAATSQRAFEECFLEIAKPYLEKFPKMPVCLAGGCALNIILNTRIKCEFDRNVFVGPVPNDAGIATGLLLAHIQPHNIVDVTYKGIPLLDYDCIIDYAHTIKSTKKIMSDVPSNYDPKAVININEIIDDLKSGYIVGVARGNSEHGPRALGNRSILCNPLIANMKDILNQKVKRREWYRPFAPVVRLEDVNKYFEWEGESRWMSFCPKVREEWRSILVAITHVDGTARVQTVTREQNEWLYDLLTEFEKITGVGVLLNTSFNLSNKPILSSIKDAFEIFETTDLDRLVIEDFYFSK